MPATRPRISFLGLYRLAFSLTFIIFANMKNIYHRDIMEILLAQGNEGLYLRQIARQVYNRHVGLFNTDLDYRDIYQRIRFYLWHQSKMASSPFVRGKQRGRYAIKPNLSVQMDIHFDAPAPPQPESEPARPETDYPSLFPSF